MGYPNKNQWVKTNFSDVFWFQEGPGVRNWQFTNTGIKLLNVANITKSGNIDLSKTDRCLSIEEVEEKYKHFLVDEGDLVIASSGISFDTDGLLRTRGAFIDKGHLPLCMNTSTIRFKSKEEVSDLSFLKFWLDSFEFRKQITRFVTGSAQQNFGPSHLKELQITLPPLEEQKRIAQIAGKCDRLRRTRRYTQQLSDTYLQSVFLEMFGDPWCNPKDWAIKRLGDLLAIPPNIGTIAPAQDFGEQLCVRVGEIGKWQIQLNACKRVTLSEKERERFSLLPGDIVLARAIGSESHLGKLSIMQDTNLPVAFDSHVMRLRPNQKLVLSEFIACWMQVPGGRARFMKQARQTAVQFNINGEQISNIDMPLPPLSQQEKFLKIVHRYDRLRAQQQESDRQAEHLFQSILHRAFHGEL
jgi:type I restriction enzyme, S subunit